jgi:hypothetical protein
MRFWALNVTGAALLIAGWMQGAVAFVFMNDPTYLTWALFGVFVVGLAAMWLRFSRTYKFIVDELLTMGLMGTLAGLFMILAGDPTADELLYGLGTALGTTLVASVARLWLLIVNELK